MKEVIVKIDLGDLEKSILERMDAMEKKQDEILSRLNNGNVPPVEIPEPEIPGLPQKTVTITSEEWSKIVDKGYFFIPDGTTILIPNYKTEFPNKNGLIESDGKARIIWGKDYYNQWRGDGSEAQVILNLQRWNHTFRFFNVDALSAKMIDEVQPFYRTLFQNTPDKGQTGKVELINSDTNMEFTFLYSGGQEENITSYAKKVKFKGPIWQELKANNGGGIVSIIEDSELIATDPITHFRAVLAFSQGEVRSSVSFDLIENKFIENGNSCNILYLPDHNATFYLPKGLEDYPFAHRIRTIPLKGEIHNIHWAKEGYLRSDKIELQAGDRFVFQGIEYTITSKDRASQEFFSNKERDGKVIGYHIEYGLDKPIPVSAQDIKIVIVQSKGESLIANGPVNGYMIFKYNERFHTNINPPLYLDLDYYLKSNPFGVLFYNHKEVSVILRRTKHRGFYRQSSSGIGKSKGYEFTDSEPFKNEFNPGKEVPITII